MIPKFYNSTSISRCQVTGYKMTLIYHRGAHKRGIMKWMLCNHEEVSV